MFLTVVNPLYSCSVAVCNHLLDAVAALECNGRCFWEEFTATGSSWSIRNSRSNWLLVSCVVFLPKSLIWQHLDKFTLIFLYLTVFAILISEITNLQTSYYTLWRAGRASAANQQAQTWSFGSLWKGSRKFTVWCAAPSFTLENRSKLLHLCSDSPEGHSHSPLIDQQAHCSCPTIWAMINTTGSPSCHSPDLRNLIRLFPPSKEPCIRDCSYGYKL